MYLQIRITYKLAVSRTRKMSLEKMSHRIKYAVSWVIVEDSQNNIGWVSVESVYHMTLQLLKTLTRDSSTVLPKVNPKLSSTWHRWLHVTGQALLQVFLNPGTIDILAG